MVITAVICGAKDWPQIVVASQGMADWLSGYVGRLDIVFRQDDSRYRDRVGARNFAVVRKIVLNAVSRETSIKGGIATRQYAASFNPVYRDIILNNLF